MDSEASFHHPEKINDNDLQILLTEYQAIERMHAHYDVINMSITAIITAGVFTFWGIVVQSAFQPHEPIENPIFVNNVSILSLTLLFVLSIWIRYITIHRCIVYEKLNRSHEIENILGMKQNLIFRHIPEKLKAPINSDFVKRRPGGHTLELLLYFSLGTMGGLIAIVFQWHLREQWTYQSVALIYLLFLSPVGSILWMTFCKYDSVIHIKGKVEVGFPWRQLFDILFPISNALRRLVNSHTKEF